MDGLYDYSILFLIDVRLSTFLNIIRRDSKLQYSNSNVELLEIFFNN